MISEPLFNQQYWGNNVSVLPPVYVWERLCSEIGDSLSSKQLTLEEKNFLKSKTKN